MGDPKFSRPKYTGPSHPWDGERIKAEKELVKKYGLKNKKELWKLESALRRFRRTARNLQARLRVHDAQAEKERDELLERLQRIGILGDESDLNDILALQVECLLNRRLQTVVHLKGMAYSPKQARQFIVHGHIALKGRKVTIPGFIVKVKDDEEISYTPSSPISDELHPMRPKSQEEREMELAEAAAEVEAKEGAEKTAEAEKEAPEEKDKDGPEEKEASEDKKGSEDQKDSEEKRETDEKEPEDLKVVPGGDS